MLFLVRQILGIYTNDFAALITIVGKNVLVAFDAVRMVISKNIAMSS